MSSTTPWFACCSPAAEGNEAAARGCKLESSSMQVVAVGGIPRGLQMLERGIDMRVPIGLADVEQCGFRALDVIDQLLLLMVLACIARPSDVAGRVALMPDILRGRRVRGRCCLIGRRLI